MRHSNRIDGKRQRVKTILSTTLMAVTAALLMVPFYFMFLSSLDFPIEQDFRMIPYPPALRKDEHGFAVIGISLRH